MPELKFTTRPSGLMPMDDESRVWLVKQPKDAVVTGKFSTDRNGAFHRKFFAMLNVAYLNWDNVEIETAHGKAKTSQKTFKDFCIVKSGHWQIDVTPEGNARYTPKSIKFGNMSQADFEKLYSDVLDVILAKFLTKWTSEDMHDAVVNYIRDFG
jgi:hypothetical protein